VNIPPLIHDTTRCRRSGCARLLLAMVVALGSPMAFAQDETAGTEAGHQTPWWYRYPTYTAVVDEQVTLELNARMVSHNISADPGWGPYGQYDNSLRFMTDSFLESYRQTRKAGVRWITWMEAFGDCMTYAVSLYRQPDGSFECRENDPETARLTRNAWNWEAPIAEHGKAEPGEVERGNTLRWVGLHNTVNNEDFVQPLFTREQLGFPTPTYPDGSEAIGWLASGQYPINARVYDACGARDINGDVCAYISMAAEKANQVDETTGQRQAPTEGLYRKVLDANDVFHTPQRKAGDIVYASLLCVEKDTASPFWVDYARWSVRRILDEGLDGMWCDNYACFNNFGMPPIRNGFGAWSEQRFREFLKERFSDSRLSEMGIVDAMSFDVRGYLKRKAAEFGAKDPSLIWDRAWRDARWLDDPVWNAYKVFKQQVGQEALRGFYTAVKEEAKKAGRPDFLVAGNDMPVYALGWARDEWLDMVSSEQTAAWFVTTGSRGIMLPPLGKYAVVYRAALEHQKGPYATVWYYISGVYEKYRESTELGKVLQAEAFANSTFIKHGGATYAGTAESHTWWNKFVVGHEEDFGRRFAVADVGILFSPDNQLANVVPGSHALDHERQAHSFGHWGFATAMIDGHIPYRVVVDWKLNRECLNGLRAFIIPYAECLEDSTGALLQEWVRDGGRLVISGPSGMREGTTGFFKRRSSSVLASLVGTDMSGRGQEVSSTGDGPITVMGSDATDVITIDTEPRDDPSPRAEPGKENSESAGNHSATHVRVVGKGQVVWTPTPAGMDYYSAEKEREERLPQIVEIVGGSSVLDARALPATIGVFCWRSDDGRTLFADLVNYDIDLDADRVKPADNIQFRLRLPEGCEQMKVTTLSPDKEEPATATIRHEWAEIRLPRLVHFASVRLVAK